MMEAIENKYDYDVLTPIEKHGPCWFKRDDFYKPYEDFGITGGKVRQCRFLIQSNLQLIQEKYDSTVATAASVFSPQAVIVARVAKEFGLKCIIGMGTTNPDKHKAMVMCKELGAELVTLVTSNAYNGVLYASLKRLNNTRNFFTINFGYQAKTESSAILGMNSFQVTNLPKDVDYLVIPVGSAVTAAGIISGCIKDRPELLLDGRIVLVQPFGYDRKKTILDSIDLDFGDHLEYDYRMGSYPYHTPLQKIVGDVVLDDIYESKAYDYIEKNMPELFLCKTVFWIVGDSNILRV